MEKPEKHFKVSELAEYLPESPSVHTIKKWVQQNKIPFHKAGSAKNSRLLFKKSEIDKWVENGRREN